MCLRLFWNSLFHQLRKKRTWPWSISFTKNLDHLRIALHFRNFWRKTWPLSGNSLDNNSVLFKFQSGFCKLHRIETEQGYKSPINSCRLWTLVLLDLSTASDTINHARLINRLNDQLGGHFWNSPGVVLLSISNRKLLCLSVYSTAQTRRGIPQ